TAPNALAGARKWNSFGSAVPRVVTDVSRLTIDTSACLRTSATGPNAVVGLSSSLRVRSVKWTSPAKSRVIVGGPGCEVMWGPEVVPGVHSGPPGPEHAEPPASRANAAIATVRRRVTTTQYGLAENGATPEWSGETQIEYLGGRDETLTRGTPRWTPTHR